MNPADEKDLRKYLTPFADGELDVEQSVRVLEHMAMNPQATQREMHQQQLRQAIGRHLLARAPSAPPDLKARLETLINASPLPVAGPSANAVQRSRAWRIFP